MTICEGLHGVVRSIATMGLWMVAASSVAAPLIDQSYLVPTNQNRPGHQVNSGTLAAAQVLTVGVDGILTQIDLQVGGQAAYPMTMQIGLGTNPNTDTVLAAFNFTAPQWTPIGTYFYAITSIDVSSAMIDVDPGDHLVLSLYSASNTFGGWALGDPISDGVYAGGGAFSGSPSSMSVSGLDLAFRTWVDPAVATVPEPASGVLVVLALGLAALLRRRASRAAATQGPAALARRRSRPRFSSLAPGFRGGMIALAFGCTQSMAAPIVFFGEDLGAGSAAAMPNAFAARDAFVAGLGSYGTEQFEGFVDGSFFPDAGALTFSGTTVTADISGGFVRSSPLNARFPTSGTNYIDTSFNQRITFSSEVAAFGLFVTDANELDNDPAAVTVNGQTLTQAQIEARPFDSVDGIFRIITERSPGIFELLFDGGTFPALDSSGMFVGIIDSANPFSNVILINGASGLDVAFQDGFGYDDMIVGTIPEPGTLALLCLGLAGMAVMRREAAPACPQ